MRIMSYTEKNFPLAVHIVKPYTKKQDTALFVPMHLIMSTDNGSAVYHWKFRDYFSYDCDMYAGEESATRIIAIYQVGWGDEELYSFSFMMPYDKKDYINDAIETIISNNFDKMMSWKRDEGMGVNIRSDASGEFTVNVMKC